MGRTNQLMGPPAAAALEEAAGVLQKESRSPVGNLAKELRGKMVDARELNVQNLQCKLEELRETMMQKDKTIDRLREEVSRLPSERSSAASSRRPSLAPVEQTEQTYSDLSVKLTQRRISCSSQSRKHSTQLEKNPL